MFRLFSSRSEQALRAVEMAKKVRRCETSFVLKLKLVVELQAADAAAAKKAQEAAATKKAQEEAAATKKAQEEAAATKKAQEEAAAAEKKKVWHC